MRVAIVGAGWNGCHLALELAKLDHEVTLFEQGPTIMSGVSGQFGIRLHRGPHYPRSKRTRESCQDSFDRFCSTYPELVVQHEESIYACGQRDADDCPSKVSGSRFANVCKEFGELRAVDIQGKDLKGLECAYDLDEPSVVVGGRLRSFFEKRLARARVRVLTSTEVKLIETSRSGHLKTKIVRYTANNAILKWLYNTTAIRSVLASSEVDIAINATGFQDLIPPSLRRRRPANLEIIYQICLGLKYTDTMPESRPISFIVMDGWFPCLMPLVQSPSHRSVSHPSSNTRLDARSSVARQEEYILTHGSFTIQGSFSSPKSAASFYKSRLSDEYVKKNVLDPTESDMRRFWPSFTERFNYKGWHGAILAKPRTQTELRTSLVFEKDGIIYVFPGKISNVFSACDEVLQLMHERSHGSENVIVDEGSGCTYAKDSSLHLAQDEIQRKPGADSRNTSNLRPQNTRGIV